MEDQSSPHLHTIVGDLVSRWRKSIKPTLERGKPEQAKSEIEKIILNSDYIRDNPADTRAKPGVFQQYKRAVAYIMALKQLHIDSKEKYVLQTISNEDIALIEPYINRIEQLFGDTGDEQYELGRQVGV